MNVGGQVGLPTSSARFDEARADHAEEAGERQSRSRRAATKPHRSHATDGTIATHGCAHRESWCFPKKHGLHFAALDGPIFIEKTGRLIDQCFNVRRDNLLANDFSFISMCVLASCAYIENPHPDGESYRDRPITTGSNLPKRNTAASVDPADIDAMR
jgi:hypothetical protein